MYDTFVITMSPDSSDIDSSDVSNEIKAAYSNVFSILINNPAATDQAANVLSNYYTNEFETLTAIPVQPSTSQEITPNSTVAQLDMDGNVVFVSSVADFSNTKESAKDILGSAERINDSEILVADSVNKRAIVVNTVSDTITWQYDSDRYVIDAHIVSNNSVSHIVDEFVIVECDGLESPFTGRVIKVDFWGNIVESFGEGYLVKPRDARIMQNNKILVSV